MHYVMHGSLDLEYWLSHYFLPLLYCKQNILIFFIRIWKIFLIGIFSLCMFGVFLILKNKIESQYFFIKSCLVTKTKIILNFWGIFLIFWCSEHFRQILKKYVVRCYNLKLFHYKLMFVLPHRTFLTFNYWKFLYLYGPN